RQDRRGHRQHRQRCLTLSLANVRRASCAPDIRVRPHGRRPDELSGGKEREDSMELSAPQGRPDERDRGGVAVFLVPAVMIVVLVALAIMLPLGSAVLDRRTASTAADAAALA